MFCPNCGTQIALSQKFCRGCGLRLEKIAEELALQLPTQAHANKLRRVLLFEKIGVVLLVVFGLIIVGGILYMSIFGVNLKPVTAIATVLILLMLVCGLLSMFFFNYANELRERITNPRLRENELPAANTARLLEEKPFEPIASVTERTTDLLPVEKSKTTNELG